jgi:ribosomal protein L29
MKAVDLRKLEVSELLVKLTELKRERLHGRIARTMKSDTPHAANRLLKKTIARVNTILTEKGHH